MASNNTPKKRTKTELNSEIVYKIVTKACKSGDPNKYLNQDQIVDEFRIHKIRQKKGDEKKDINKKSLQPTVSRALTQLVTNNKLAKTSDKKYIPFNEEVRKNNVANEIIKKITFNKREIFQISDSTIAVNVASKDLYMAKNLFLSYLTDKHCYDILEINTYLVIMLKTSIDINDAEVEYHEKLLEDSNEVEDKNSENTYQSNINTYVRELMNLRVEIIEIVKTAFDESEKKKQKKFKFN